jgi:hypothetical protein
MKKTCCKSSRDTVLLSQGMRGRKNETGTGEAVTYGLFMKGLEWQLALI